MSTKDITVRLKAITDGYSTALRSAAAETKAFGSEVVKQAGAGDQAMRDLGKGAVVAGSALLVGTAYGIKAYADFDQKLTGSLAIMGDITEYQRSDMAAAAREVATTTRYSAGEAADAYFFLASAGFDAKQSIGALPRVAAFAQAGNFDLARATDLLTDAQSALGLVTDDTAGTMSNMTRVSDVLVKANVLANASVEQFSRSLTNKAGAALRLLNKDMEEGVAVLAAFADQGVKGEEAGERLNIVLRDLQTSSIKNKDAWTGMGLAVYDSDGKMRNIADIIGDLTGVLSGASDEQARMTLMQLGFQDRSVSAIQTLLGLEDKIRGYESALRDAGGVTDEVAEKQIQNLNDQLGLAMSKWTDFAMEMGAVVAPALGGIVGIFGDVADALGDLPGPLKTVVGFAVPLVGMALTVGGGFLLLAPRIVKTKQALDTLALTSPKVVAALRAMPMALGVVGGALVAATFVLVALNKAKQEAEARTREFVQALQSEADGLDGATDAMLTNQLITDGSITTLASLGVTVDDYIDAVKAGGKQLDDLTVKMVKNAGEAGVSKSEMFALMKQLSLNTEGYAAASAEIEELTAQQRWGTDETARYATELFGLQDILEGTETGTDALTGAVGSYTTALFGLQGLLGDTKSGTEDVTGAMGQAEAATQSYADTVRALTDPVFAAQRAMRRYKDAAAEVAELEAEGKWGTEEWAEAMLDLSGAVIDADGALAELSMDPAALNAAIQSIATALGISEDEARLLLDTLGLLDGTTVTVTVNETVNRRVNHIPNEVGAYADGVIATRPTLGVFGEAGPEAVIPLNQRGADFFAAAIGQRPVEKQESVKAGVTIGPNTFIQADPDRLARDIAWMWN